MASDKLGRHLILKHNWNYENNSKHYYDLYIKQPDEGMCKCCGKETKYKGLVNGYAKYCSMKCSATEFLIRTKKTKLDRYDNANYNNRDKFIKTMTDDNLFHKSLKKGKATRLKKYGDENYNNRSKYQETCFNKFGVTCNLALKSMRNPKSYSKISQKLFFNIYKSLSDDLKQSTYFYKLNDEYRLNLANGKYYLFDFVIEKIKFAIEFNGDIFHANPAYYNENDTPNPFKNNTAKEIWQADKLKNLSLQSLGYKVLIIWESEYKNDALLVENNIISYIYQLTNLPSPIMLQRSFNNENI